MIYSIQRNEMMGANIWICYVWSRYQSLQCSLCPRWQQTLACIDNGPASSEKSVSNCLWCRPMHRQNDNDVHADGMKTRCSSCMNMLGSSIMSRQNSEWNCTINCAEHGHLDDMIRDDKHEAHNDTHWQFGHTHTQTHTHINTHWVSSWPPGHFLWPWCQMGVPGSPWPSGCHGQQGPRPAGRCWCRLCRGGRLSLTIGHAATAPRCHFQTGLGWMPVTEKWRRRCTDKQWFRYF